MESMGREEEMGKFETGEARNSKEPGQALDKLHVIYNCA